jgi:hypothetical protein
MSELYLYCFTESVVSLPELTGIASTAAPRIVTWGEVSAVVSDGAENRYRVSRKNVNAHNHVIEACRALAATVPVRFGTLAPSETALLGLLQKQQHELITILDNVRGVAEYALRAEWFNKDALLAQLGERHSQIQSLRERVAARGASYHDRIALGQKVDEVLSSTRETLEETLAELAAEHAKEVLILDLQDETSDVANLALLMSDTAYDAFMADLTCFDEQQPDLLRLRMTGPLAAFSFADLTLVWS